VSTIVDASAITDQGRWELAYREAFPRVYRGVVALGARPDEAEDALQDAFVKGMRRSGIRTVDAWLFVVAVRSWRRRRLRDRLLLPFAAASREVVPEQDHASRVAFLAALRALPERQRQIVVARYIVGLSQEETASALGISRGTVSATTTQAAAALRRALRVEETR
jgi:RNA polymerase sigma-70 factor (ECF subfamily)